LRGKKIKSSSSRSRREERVGHPILLREEMKKKRYWNDRESRSEERGAKSAFMGIDLYSKRGRSHETGRRKPRIGAPVRIKKRGRNTKGNRTKKTERTREVLLGGHADGENTL